MSRCKACDVILNEHELKRIDHQTGYHLDLCNECAAHSNDAVLDEINNELEDINKVFNNIKEEEIDSLLST